MTLSVQDGLKLEMNYFYNHSIYSNKKYEDKLGIPSLCKNLGNILVKSLKKCFPSILEKLTSELLENKYKLEKLGTPVPEDKDLQSAFIHKTIAKINRTFISILEDRGKNINSGRNIKHHFINFRTEIKDLDPFNQNNFSEEYIQSAISNCEGNHMSFLLHLLKC